MINWFAVLRRIMSLYHVKTQQDLGMALGVPVHVGMDGGAEPPVIPWTILEIVVAEKKVSWDWLLAAKEDENEAPPKTPAEQPEQKPAAAGTGGDTEVLTRQTAGERIGSGRWDTRELERDLLTQRREQTAPAAEADSTAAAASSSGRSETAAETVRRLEALKATMQQEMDKIESMLGGLR